MNRSINFVRAVLHTLLLAVTVVPWALAAVVMRLFGNQKMVDAICLNWLRLSVKSGTAILGIHNRVTDRKSTRLNSSHRNTSRMPSSA